MLFNPTPLEKLSTLIADLIAQQQTLRAEIETLRSESALIKGSEQSKDTEIERLNAIIASKDEEIKMYGDELASKDAEIEAIVSKIESLLG